VLEHGLARPERSRGAERSADRDREEGVDGTLLGDQRLLRQQLFGVVGDGDLDRPLLGHGDVAAFALAVDRDRHHVVDGVFAGGGDRFERPFVLPGERNHDVMGDHAFRHRADAVAGPDLVARLGDRGERPLEIAVERAQVNAALEEKAGFLGQERQRVLQPVVNLGQEAGPEFDREQFPGEFDLVADLEAVGALEDLEVGAVAAHADDFALELDVVGVADAGERHFILHDAIAEFNGNHVAIDGDHLFGVLFTLCHLVKLLTRMDVITVERRRKCGRPPC